MAREYDPGGQIGVRHHNIGPLAYGPNPGGDLDICDISPRGVAPRMDSQNRRRVFYSTIFDYKSFWYFSVEMFVTEISKLKFLPPPPE